MSLTIPTSEQEGARAVFRAFADAEVRPGADRCDRDESLPREVIERIASRGFLGALVPREYGGSAMDMISYGFLNEEMGAACSSVRSLLTVHGMVSHSLVRWGSESLRARWLPLLASGGALGAFAATEPDVGSDLRHVATTATEEGDGYVLNGTKRWISFGEIADLFLVLATVGDRPLAVLVEADRVGLTRRPLRGLLGTRASMLAEITLRDCRVPATNALGRPGFGAGVLGSALDMGRYSVAWGCVGIGQACLDASGAYSHGRRQFGQPLAQHQLVQRMLADMMTGVRAARLLCLQAGASKEAGLPGAVVDTLVAKYFASSTAMRAATDAVQLHGANGCSADYPVARYLRDAKTMEIIEGTTEIQQVLISRHVRMDTQAHDVPLAGGSA